MLGNFPSTFGNKFVLFVRIKYPQATIEYCDFQQCGQTHGYKITFPNGYVVSIQFGAVNYCDNRSFVTWPILH